MKLFSFSRYLGLGFGVGIASLAIYHSATRHIPEPFDPGLTAFRSLSELELRSDGLLLDTNDVPAVLINYDVDETDDNQIVLPALDELKVEELRLCPELSFDSPESPASAGEESLETQLDTEFDTNELSDTNALSDTSQSEQIELESADIEDHPPATAPEVSEPTGGPRLSEVPGSTWKSNPFLDAGSKAVKDPVANFVDATDVRSTSLASPQIANDPNSSVSVPVPTVQMAGDQNSNDFVSEVSKLDPPQQIPMDQTNQLDQSNQTDKSDLTNQSDQTFQTDQSDQASSQMVTEPVESQSFVAASNDRPQLQPELANQPSLAPENIPLPASVVQRASHHIEYGKALTRRGATFAARQEFYSSLRILAQANDSMTGTHQHTSALRDGIMALKEAKDFMVRDTESRIGLQVSHVIETHFSDILTAEEATRMTPVEAMQSYFAFAEQQLETAVGVNVVGSETLFCLGKLHTSVAQADPSSGRLDNAKAVVYHRVAMAGDENNYQSANELGVLLARGGQLHKAKDLLKKSLMINPRPQTWQNLSKVHRRLGEDRLAKLAQSEFALALQKNASRGIHWMAPRTFNDSAAVGFHESVAAKPRMALEPDQAGNDEKSKSFGQRLKDLF